jgi:hypothetical protein
MSLVLAGLVVAGTSGALVVGRWLARRWNKAEDGAVGEKKEKNEDKPEDADEARARAEVELDGEAPSRKDESDERANDGNAPSPGAPKRNPRPAPEGDKVRLEGFVCQLGDVLMRITGEEAWLAGGLVLSEEVPVAVLFVAPDAVHDHAIYVRPRPRASLFWLEPLDPSAILVAGEPPSSVEHRGIRFDRARRLPLRPRRIGVGAPDVGDAVIVAEYTSAGSERLLVVKGSSGVVRAYRGLELEQGSFEVIASGESTLD